MSGASRAARARTTYACSECGWETAKWVGRCTGCRAFSTMVERTVAAPAAGRPATQATRPTRPARPVGEVSRERTRRIRTGLPEFDRVLGGGLVAGQVLLLAGEPGVGKSTLLLEVSQAFSAGPRGEKRGPDAQPRTVLYVSGEESAEQIGVRAERVGADSPGLLVADETDLDTVLGHLDATSPALVVVDSVQTVASVTIEGRAGGVGQVTGATQALTSWAKRAGVPMLLIGQSTKDNNVAGPRSLEHLVDTVLTFEGDRHTALRLLRAVKNRFGPAEEVACFEQRDSGLFAVSDPSQLFRAQRDQPVAGTCTTISMEGRRPLVAEVQALVSKSSTPQPRRAVSGVDHARLAMLLAVTEKYGGVKLGELDVYVATVAGLRLTTPSCDLAVTLAIWSALTDIALSRHVAAVGEVALSGDIRPVQGLGQRVAEAARLGFTRILVPPIADRGELPAELRNDTGVRLVEVGTLAKAFKAAQVVPPAAPRQPA
ncbi:DNA repair protein RadA/Sms [Nocardioides massiliensis]|uniref:DNA repair protein RadA n=2 Tax=Nocardioides massiliensis TaxID=1325935 RepID=A0ABT9NMJ3_9ACTN|nr:DNA repair protein RadA [Nocardioides massiliensis]MDP9821644.1 DNA repair protein RadA/Sms [Nocardioides massiliensis]